MSNTEPSRAEVRLTAISAYSGDDLDVRWLVEDQSYVETGDIIADVELAKATLSLEANKDGVISILFRGELDSELPIDTVLATIETPSDAQVIR